MDIQIDALPAHPLTATPEIVDVLVHLFINQPAADEVPLDLGLVIDTSGSMGGLPLDLAKEAGRQMLRRLHPYDRVTLVGFANGPTMHAPLLAVGDGVTLARQLDRLHAAGCTALHPGWQLGLGLLMAARHPRRFSSILLVTDGRPNVGEQRTHMIADAVAQGLLEGVSTSTVGVGLRYNEGLLEALADAGDGHFHHAEAADELYALFQTELDHLRRTVGRQVTLTLDGAEVLDVFNDLPRHGSTIGLPPLRSGQSLSLVLRVRASGGAPWRLTLRWTDLQAQVQRTVLESAFPLCPAGVERTERPEVAQERNRLIAARVQRQAAVLLDRGDVGRALDVLTHSRRQLLHAQDHGADVGLELGQLEDLARRIGRGDRGAASKKAKSQAYDKSTGRENRGKN